MSVVYIYNPDLHATELNFSGRVYRFPSRKTVELQTQRFTAPDSYRQNLADGSEDDRRAMHVTEFDAETFAKMILNRHYVNYMEQGWIVSDKQPTETEKQRAHIAAAVFWTRQVDEFMQERRERQSGGMGRLVPDQKLVDWMLELGIEDEFYNKKSKNADLEKIAERVGVAVGASVAQALASNKSASSPKAS